MNKEKLLAKLSKVERIACLSKVGRLLYDPSKYIGAMYFRHITYPGTKKERIVNTPVFWGSTMQIALPASNDIYLTGGKSHPSEILLARFIINHLSEGAHFLDIGAHYGYFSLLASVVAGDSGKVYSFEPSMAACSILKVNSDNAPGRNITVHKEAVSDVPGTLTFYEFPNLYSEYNTLDVAQFGNEKWFKEYKPQPNAVNAKTIDMITANGFCPAMIKIDVEGAEHKAISGGRSFFTNNDTHLIMEYLNEERGNEAHREASQLLRSMGYYPHRIDKNGMLDRIDDIEKHLAEKNIDSDNIVFKK